MKKTILTAIIFLFITAGTIFAQNGVIREMTGTVEVKRAGAAAFTPAKTGDSIAKDTVVSTGFKSTALIMVGSAIITVRPLTRLTLEELSAAAGTETINVNLQAGRVRVDVNPPAGTRTSANVRSPSATASVRGTSFEFDTRNLAVQSGTVAFSGRKGKVRLVSAGSTSTVREDNKVTNPRETNAANLLPPLPPGTDSGAGKDGGPTARVEFGITLQFN